jgi:hypothetical protein
MNSPPVSLLGLGLIRRARCLAARLPGLQPRGLSLELHLTRPHLRQIGLVALARRVLRCQARVGMAPAYPRAVVCLQYGCPHTAAQTRNINLHLRMQLDIIEGRKLWGGRRTRSGLQLECAPPHGPGMGFEPPQFQCLGPVDVGEAMRSGVAQEFVPLVVEGKSRHSVGGPAAESFRKWQGLWRGRFWRASRGRSWSWDRG